MVPTMLVTLGVQLTKLKDFHFSTDMFVASGVRLLGGPLLAFLLVIPFGLTGLERGAAILQASMPNPPRWPPSSPWNTICCPTL